MKMHNVRMHLAQHSRESHCAANVCPATLPVDHANVEAHPAQCLGNSAILPEHNHGEPVTTGIHGRSQIHHGEGYSAGLLPSASKHVDDVARPQAVELSLVLPRTALRTR